MFHSIYPTRVVFAPIILQFLECFLRIAMKILFFLLTAISNLLASDSLITKRIIGLDQRVELSSLSQSMFNGVGHLGTYCTASVIGQNHILTAAHCVYHFKNQEWVDSLYFKLQQTHSELPFGVFDWEEVFTFKQYSLTQDKNFDIALIKLRKSIPNFVKAYTLKSNQTPNEKIVIGGYPGDKEDNTFWYSNCNILDVTHNRFSYECDTSSGMSGAPVLNNENQIIGIHTLGEESCNSAVSLNTQKIEAIKSWLIGNKTSDTIHLKNPYQKIRPEHDDIYLINNCNKSQSIIIKWKDLDKKHQSKTIQLSSNKKAYIGSTTISKFTYQINQSKITYKINTTNWGDVIVKLNCVK